MVISHLHPDHCVDLMSLRVYMLWGPGAGGRLRLLGPPGLRERLTAFSGSEGWDEAFAFEELGRPGGRADLGGGLVLRYREVPHLPPTFAMRLEWGGAALCYGADCAPGPELPELAAGCGVLVCEASFGAEPVPEGVPHLPAREAGAHRRPGGGRPPAAHPLRAGIRPRRRPRGRAGRVLRPGQLGPAGGAGDRVTMRRRPPPTRRGLILAMVLSLLLPGLGQAYQGRLWRALIWFGGTVLIAVVLGRGGDNTSLALAMGTAIAVASALDILVVARVESRSRSGL